jgi:four helix bundle protein
VRLYTKLAKLNDVPPHLARQVLSSGTSIGANLEEAKGAQTRRDLAAKFSIALAEHQLTQGNQMTQQRLPWVTDTRHRSPDFKSEEFEV